MHAGSDDPRAACPAARSRRHELDQPERLVEGGFHVESCACRRRGAGADEARVRGQRVVGRSVSARQCDVQARSTHPSGTAERRAGVRPLRAWRHELEQPERLVEDVVCARRARCHLVQPLQSGFHMEESCVPRPVRAGAVLARTTLGHAHRGPRAAVDRASTGLEARSDPDAHGIAGRSRSLVSQRARCLRPCPGRRAHCVRLRGLTVRSCRAPTRRDSLPPCARCSSCSRPAA